MTSFPAVMQRKSAFVPVVVPVIVAVPSAVIPEVPTVNCVVPSLILNCNCAVAAVEPTIRVPPVPHFNCPPSPIIELPPLIVKSPLFVSVVVVAEVAKTMAFDPVVPFDNAEAASVGVPTRPRLLKAVRTAPVGCTIGVEL